MKHALWMTAGLLALATPLAAQSKESLVAAELLADAATVQPGGTFHVGALFRIEPGWHIYWINPGDAGQPTTVQLKAPPGFVVGPWHYPVPTRFEQPGQITGYGYADSVLLIAEVRAPTDLRTGEAIRLEGRASWLVCKDVCVPGKADLKLVLNTGPAGRPANTELFRAWQDRLPQPPDAAASAVAGVEQSGVPPEGRKPGRFEVAIDWKQPPQRVEWFPQTPPALAINDIEVSTQGKRTRITFAARVLLGQSLDANSLPSIVGYNDIAGRERGISLAIHLHGPASQPTRPTTTGPS